MAAGKFIFGEDFGRRPAAPLAPSASEKARADELARARAAGVAEGRALARRELDQRQAQALEAVAGAIDALLARFGAVEAAAQGDAIDFARRFGAATAGVALKRFPLAALEAAAREAFGQLRQTPHCVVRLHESLVEEVDALLQKIARERGYEGRVVVMGEADMAAGDFSLEWADGGVGRDGEALGRRLQETIERHMAAAAENA